VAQHFDAPRLGCLVELADDVGVDRGALLERAVELDLADLAAQRRLRELRDRELVVRDAVRRARRIEDLHVQDAVDADLDVIPRDADLLRDVDRHLLQAVLVGDALHERREDVEPGLQRAAVFAPQLDDVRALLRYDDRRLRQEEDREHRDRHTPNQCLIHGFSRWAVSGLQLTRTRSVRPSTASIRTSSPAGIGWSPTLSAVQPLPRYSMRIDLPGPRASGIRTRWATS